MEKYWVFFYYYFLSCLRADRMYHQAHPWFGGVAWDKLYEMDAAFKPQVNDELDTQNFMKFEEVNAPCTPTYPQLLIFSNASDNQFKLRCLLRCLFFKF
jgi:hypothetical protein